MLDAGMTSVVRPARILKIVTRWWPRHLLEPDRGQAPARVRGINRFAVAWGRPTDNRHGRPPCGALL